MRDIASSFLSKITLQHEGILIEYQCAVDIFDKLNNYVQHLSHGGKIKKDETAKFSPDGVGQ